MFTGGFLVPFLLVIIFYILVLQSIKSKGRSLRSLFESEELGGKLSPPPTPTGSKNNRSNTLTFGLDVQSTSLINRSSQQRGQSLVSEVVAAVGGGVGGVGDGDSMGGNNGMSSHMRTAIVKREFQATKSVAICVGFFCLAWLPNAIIVLFTQFGVDMENYVTPISASLPGILANTSTIFNPLIYTLLNPDFKVHFRRVLKLGNQRSKNNNTIDFV